MNDLVNFDEKKFIEVAQSSLYPSAQPESIRLVIEYCRQAKLDPMQKPVHIVPMFCGKTKRMRDVILPGIALYRMQASRNGCIEISCPEFGEEIEETLGGQKIVFPKWCKVSVKKKLACGEIGEFTAIEFWKENYAMKGGVEKSIAPNAMWTKRPFAQLAKCAEAQALRRGFPEIFGGQPTAEEMQGKAFNEASEIILENNSNADKEIIMPKRKANVQPQIEKLSDEKQFFEEEKATLGEVSYILKKIADAGLTEKSALEAIGTNLETVQGISKECFFSLRDYLS